jgi:RNA polymerase sigma factor (sigma-70 family)
VWAVRGSSSVVSPHVLDRRSRAARRGIDRRQRLARDPVADDRADDAQAIAVREALSALPPRQRTALILRYYLDQSVEEAADVMQCAPGTVKAATHQAIASLRRNQHLFTVTERT